MRKLLPLLLILAALSVSSFATDRPNILLIVSEDNGPELGCYGDPHVKTPVLDNLAAEGVCFEKAFVPQSGCSQSRAAYLTGLYPHQNGHIGLATWKFCMYREDTPNIVRSLKEAGYRTGIIGKLHVNPASAFPFDMKKIPSSNFSRKNLGDYAKHAADFFSEGDKPFFLSINYPDTHRPFLRQVRELPARPLSGADVKPLAYFGLDTPQLRTDTANYYNCMSRLDSLIGELLDALRRSGKAENTLIVYLGDHGADLLRGKRTCYEGGVRVPLIVRWPGKAKPNQVRHELVSTLDLMPTLLDAAKARPVGNLPGLSLLPLLRREKSRWRKYLYTEFHLHSAHNFYPQRAVRDERYKLIQNLMPGQNNPGYNFTLNRFFADLPPAIEAAPDHIRAAYHRMKTPPEYELYDLQADPYEFRNLATDAKHTRVLDELKNQLATWRKQTNDPLLDAGNLQRLKAEVDACIIDGEPDKSRLNLTYPEYFSANSSSSGRSTEAGIDAFLGKPIFEMHELFEGRGGRSIVVAADGSVLAFNGRLLRCSTDGGKTWSEAREIGHDAGGNALVNKTNGEILLVQAGKGYLWKSKDDGRSWIREEIRILPDGFGQGTPDGVPLSVGAMQAGVTLQFGKHKGRLIMPARIQGPKASNAVKWRPYHYNTAMYSDDGGKTWQTSTPFPVLGTGEAALAEISDGSILYSSREHMSKGNRFFAWSYDDGAMWLGAYRSPCLPDGARGTSYGCMGGLIRLPVEGCDILLYSNLDTNAGSMPREVGGSTSGGRERITVWASFDGGKTWPVKRLVFDGPSAYSSLGVGRAGTPSEGRVYLFFEGGPEGMYSASNVAVFNLNWILKDRNLKEFMKN